MITPGEITIAQRRPKVFEEAIPGTWDPPTSTSVLRAGGDLPIGTESPEMIHAHNVCLAQRTPEALHPKGMTILSHPWPIINGVPPHLTHIGKGIRWCSRYHHRAAFLIQQELLPMCPHVNAVLIYIDGQIADQTYAAFSTMLPQRGPLFINEHLERHVMGNARRQPL